MKTVAFILKGYPRISETFIAQEIHLLEQKGFRIEIFSLRQAREPERQPIVERIRAPVTYLPEYLGEAWASVAWENVKCLAGHPGRYPRWFLVAVVRSIRRRSHGPIKRFLQAGWLAGRRGLGRRALRRQGQGRAGGGRDRGGCNPGGADEAKEADEAVGHLHAHFAHVPAEMTFYLSRLTGLPFSISAHAKDIYTLAAPDLVERVNASRLLMTCTDANWRHLRELPGVDTHKIHRVYHGIDLETFRRAAPLPDGEAFARGLSRFVSVGRLVPKKGYDLILMALARLQAGGVSFTYDLYGAGEEEESLRRLVRQLGLGSRVRFHRAATHPQIIERLNEGGIFLGGFRVTADGDRDGIPNTVAEAMAMEMPVLATRVSGVPELIEHGRSGYLVEPGDPEAMAAALRHLLAHPDDARSLAVRARERVREVFNCECCIESCAALLRPLLQE